MQVREKVGKSRTTVFFQWFVAPEGRKVGSLKGRVQSQLRTEKLHAVVARSTCRSQNVQNTPGSDHFWKLRCRKSARRCGAKHVSKSKCTKHTILGPLLVEKVRAVVARSTFPSQKCKKITGTEHFWTFRCAFAWQAQGIVHLVKSLQNVRVL